MRVKTIRIIEDENGVRYYMRQIQKNVIIIVPSIFYIAQGHPLSYNRYPLSFILACPYKIRRMRLKEYFFLHQLLHMNPLGLKTFFDD